jgi:thymidylate synthase (FAD)
MKLIKQSFEILEQTDYSLKGIKQFIEKCGRVCYKSEDRITDSSYEKFVDMLINKDHARPLEFGTVHLLIPESDFKEAYASLVEIGLDNCDWLQYCYYQGSYYVTTNYRYYLDIIKFVPSMQKYFSETYSKYYPKRYTVHFIISRGIMDEFRTHVTLSHLAESTRYCNYSKGKFNNELTFVQPNWLSDEHIIDYKEKIEHHPYFAMLKREEQDYLTLINNGWIPQQAREVLPLSIKSELISCGFGSAWNNFFYRRCAKDAHPMAREIATSLENKLKEMGLPFVY